MSIRGFDWWLAGWRTGRLFMFLLWVVPLMMAIGASRVTMGSQHSSAPADIPPIQLPTTTPPALPSATPAPTTTAIPISTPVPDFQRPVWVPEDRSIPDDGNAYNGYWWWDGWVPGLVTFETQFLRLPPVSLGSAVFYAPGVMESNVEYRGLSLDGMIGGVAVQFCSQIGHSVWLLRPGQDELSGWEGPYIVADCSRRNDLFGQILYRDQVVEVDFETAVRWGLARYGGEQNDGRWSTIRGRLDGVLVSTEDPQTHYNGQITDLSTWFEQQVEFAERSENHHQIQNYEPPATGGGLPSWLINGTWTTYP
jgi:hypothetical protein